MSFSDAASVFMDVPITASVFGIRLRILITVILISFIVLVLFLITFCFICIRNRNRNNVPSGSTEIEELGLETGSKVSHVGLGRWYTLRELQVATDWLSESNVIGKGGYGIVYRGILPDGTKVAVKNLFNKPEAERDFKAEVEVIGRVRHKNLVRLLGYCVEGPYMMLVYEYVDNGSLDQWLHENVASISPLTWDIRMNIMLGTAKGLAYLHEGLEQKVIHRDVKSSNVLLDSEWNAKVSDFGLVKLMCSDHSYVATRVLGTFGYVAPEYASTGMLNEKSDVYSFGMLIMEIITGKSPVDYSRPKRQINLIEWLKTQFGDKKTEEVVDSKLPEKPSLEALKRALMVAIRCVDPDPTKRPKMGNVVHLLEADDLLFLNEESMWNILVPMLILNRSMETQV
ncbi:PREDICTED: probable serine/threonine-protein kinase At1g01540 isoform X2 [Lupinus angustifolius]|uniref:probable serine/threonine-protein kinase At1g01540 isoform X2 n=1 Tax=Lupinus angustifolius TaxID=3871 RepID=UPI00092E7C69|nr:PREDICTED: probable serine/threonine-protein kinase At1g01540 isoform X2 [Lupinus angustifolius]